MPRSQQSRGSEARHCPQPRAGMVELWPNQMVLCLALSLLWSEEHQHAPWNRETSFGWCRSGWSVCFPIVANERPHDTATARCFPFDSQRTAKTYTFTIDIVNYLVLVLSRRVFIVVVRYRPAKAVEDVWSPNSPREKKTARQLTGARSFLGPVRQTEPATWCPSTRQSRWAADFHSQNCWPGSRPCVVA